MKQVSLTATVAATNLLSVQSAVTADFDLDSAFRDFIPAEEGLARAAVALALHTPGPHQRDLVWLCATLDQPERVLVFVNIFYDDAELVFEWQVTEEVYTAIILAN